MSLTNPVLPKHLGGMAPCMFWRPTSALKSQHFSISTIDMKQNKKESVTLCPIS